MLAKQKQILQPEDNNKHFHILKVFSECQQRLCQLLSMPSIDPLIEDSILLPYQPIVIHQ